MSRRSAKRVEGTTDAGTRLQDTTRSQRDGSQHRGQDTVGGRGENRRLTAGRTETPKRRQVPGARHLTWRKNTSHGP